MGEAAAPVGGGEDVGEVVVMAAGGLAEQGVLERGLGVDGVGAGAVERDGSKLANMPTFGTMGASFSGWQSQ